MGIESSLDTPLARAVRAVGSQSAYGRLVKRSQTAIYERLRTNKPVDVEDVPVVSDHTGIPRSELRPDRPDLFPVSSSHAPRDTPADMEPAR